MKVINYKLDVLTCSVFLIYFAGEAFCSYWSELGLSINYFKMFYWINKGLFGFLSSFLFSFYIVNKLTKVIVRGGSIFLFILGVFQVLNSLNIPINPIIWTILCPADIVLILISYKLCHQRKR